MTADQFSREYTAKWGNVIGFLRHRGCSDPEEIAQAAWTQAWEKREQWRGDGGAKFVVWVCIIALNMMRAEYQRGKREQLNGYDITGSFTPDYTPCIDVEKILGLCSPLHAERLRSRYIREIKSTNTGGRVNGGRLLVHRALKAVREAAGIIPTQ